jgi:hypothetical protein
LEPTDENESSVFELLDSSDLCVGEAWMTLQTHSSRPRKPLELITISWGLSLTVAQIAEERILRWTFDAVKLPEAKKFVEWRGHVEEALQLLSPPKKSLKESLSGRHGRVGMVLVERVRGREGQRSNLLRWPF